MNKQYLYKIQTNSKFMPKCQIKMFGIFFDKYATELQNFHNSQKKICELCKLCKLNFVN
jgi:hypothetical protein